MSPEQAAIWADLFGSAPEQIVQHGCLHVVEDVTGKPTRAEYERAAAALSACQTKACLEDPRTPLRCQTPREAT